MALTLRSTHPEAPNQATALGKSLTELYLRSGLIWAGYGDTFSNTGPIPIYSYDLSTNTWTLVFTAPTERVGRFDEVVGTELWATLDDPRSSVDPGYAKLAGAAGIGNVLVNGRVRNLLSENASSAETDASAWVGNTADVAITHNIAWGAHGTKSVRGTRENSLGFLDIVTAPAERVPVRPGVLYGALVTAKPSVAGKGTVTMLWYDDAGTFLGETAGPSLDMATGGTQIYGNGVPPVGATKAGFRVGFGPGINAPVGTTLDIDKMSIHEWAFQDWVLGGTEGVANWRPVHLYDFAQRVVGDIYTVGNWGVTGGAGLLRSTDAGGKWTMVQNVLGSTLRFYNVGALDGKVYTVLGDTLDGSTVNEKYVYDVGEPCYIFDGISVTRGPVLGGFIHPQNFLSKLVYRGEDNILRSFDGSTVMEIRGASLHTVGEGRCWVVDGGRVYSSTDLVTWEDRDDAPAGSTSLEIGPGPIAYFGTSDSQLWSSDVPVIPDPAPPPSEPAPTTDPGGTSETSPEVVEDGPTDETPGGAAAAWTTDEYWDVDGFVLNTVAFNIETIDGREALPPRRGENFTIGNIPGRHWTPKIPDQKPLTLVMWVQGTSLDGYGNDNDRALFNENWQKLKSVFGVFDRLLKVTRRQRFPDGIREQFCMAEVTGVMALKAIDHYSGRFAVDLMMPDPFWYEQEQDFIAKLTNQGLGMVFNEVFNMIFDTPTVTTAANVSMPIVSPGNAPSFPLIHILGPVTDPVVEHQESQLRLEFDIVIPEGQHLTIDTKLSRVLLGGMESRYNTLLPGSSSLSSFRINPGRNTLRLRSDAGLGSMIVRYSPAYL